MKLPTLELPIEANDTDYHAKMDAAESRLTDISKKAMSLGTKMSVGLTAPLALFGKSAVSSFASFDEAMTKSTSIISGMTAENRVAMEEQAKSIASTTRTSASKAAEAYYFLASAGMDAGQAIGALPIVERFATAGAFDMARATELLADSQSALGLSIGSTEERMKSMTRVSDVLVDAGNMSNASVEQFAKSLTTKSAAALRGMNKDLEEGVAVLGVYADAGIKGELAGEKLTIMLRETQNAAMKEKGAWDSLGISIYDNNGKMKNLADVVGVLEGATAGMSDQQKVARFAMLGLRSESIDAIRPLMGMTDKIRSYEKRLRSAGGATEDVAKKQMTSFSAQMDILRNQMELAAIEVGQSLAPSVVELNSHIAAGLTYWRSLSQETKDFTVTVGKLVAIAGPSLVIFAKMAQTFNAVSPAVNAAAASLKVLSSGILSTMGAFLMANPITAAIIAIGVVVAGLTALIVGPEGMASAWQTAKTYVMDFTTSAIGFLQNFTANVGILYAWIVDNWRTILTDMANAFVIYNKNMVMNEWVAIKTIMRLFVAFFGWLYGVATKAFNYIFSDEFALAIQNGTIAAFNAIVDFTIRSWEAFKSFATTAGELFMTLGKGILDTFIAIPGAIWDVLSTTAEAFGKIMKAILTGNIPDISEFMNTVATAAAESFKKATDGAVNAIAIASLAIEDKMKGVTQSVADDFNKGMSDPNFFNTAKDIMAEGMADMVSPLEGFTATTLAPQFIKGAEKMQSEAEKAGEAIAELGKDSETKGLVAAKDKVDDLNKAVNKKMKINLGKPVEAVGAFTSDALALWIEYQKKASAIHQKSGPGKKESQAMKNWNSVFEQEAMVAGGAPAPTMNKKTGPIFAPEAGPTPGMVPATAGNPYGYAPAGATSVAASAVSISSPADTAESKVETLLGQIEKNTRTSIVINQVSGRV